MAGKLKIEVNGVTAVGSNIDRMTNTIVKKLARKAVGAGLTILNKAAKAAAPRRAMKTILILHGGNEKTVVSDDALLSGTLKRSIGRGKILFHDRTGRTTGTVWARRGLRRQIGVRLRGKHAGQPVFADGYKIIHLVVGGTHRKGGTTRANPFLDQVRQQNETKIASTMQNIMSTVDQ